MKQFIPGPLRFNARQAMRAAGYGEHTGHGGQLSYTRRLRGAQYPRFHAYVEDQAGGIQINLHLDQKQASYEGSSAHGGEYEGPAVKKEMKEIVAIITDAPTQSMNTPSAPTTHSKTPPPSSSKFW